MTLPEARGGYPSHEWQGVEATARTGGEVYQGLDGRAHVKAGGNANTAGDNITSYVEGNYKLTSNTADAFLPGQEVWWDATNNEAVNQVNGDFLVGICLVDSAASADTVWVGLNLPGAYTVDMHADGYESVLVGAATSTDRGGLIDLAIIVTSEAEKSDALSVGSFAVESGWIAEFEVDFAASSSSANDHNIGVANATHATSADTIAESIFVHVDGGANDIYVESDDGVIEVAATDTLKDKSAGTFVHVMIDGRNSSDVVIYIDGVEVTVATHVMANATGPLKLLAHVEKTTGNSTGNTRVRKMRAWTTG